MIHSRTSSFKHGHRVDSTVSSSRLSTRTRVIAMVASAENAPDGDVSNPSVRLSSKVMAVTLSQTGSMTSSFSSSGWTSGSDSRSSPARRRDAKRSHGATNLAGQPPRHRDLEEADARRGGGGQGGVDAVVRPVRRNLFRFVAEGEIGEAGPDAAPAAREDAGARGLRGALEVEEDAVEEIV